MSTLNWDVCPTDMARSAEMLREGLIDPITSAWPRYLTYIFSSFECALVLLFFWNFK